MDSSVEPLFRYFRLAIDIELVVFFLYWIFLFIATLWTHAYFILLSLILPALHFVAPFGVLEILNYFEEKWLKSFHGPSGYEWRRWISQGVITLLSDSIALAVCLTIHLPELEHEHHEILAVFYTIFHVVLLVSTVVLTLAMIILWRKMVAVVYSPKHLHTTREAGSWSP